jgi:hypothetical protein
MITKAAFERIKDQHGGYASWAVWGPIGATPKSGMDDLSVFETDAVLSVLKPNIIMLGLNFSKTITQPQPFHNFHAAGNAQDFKTRYAFQDSEYCGAYMTDIIKGLPEMDSSKAMKHLAEQPQLLAESLRIFRQELQDLGTSQPIILAFGHHAYNLAQDHLRPDEYGLLVRLPHYSDYRLNKEAYKELVFRQIAAARASNQRTERSTS